MEPYFSSLVLAPQYLVHALEVRTLGLGEAEEDEEGHDETARREEGEGAPQVQVLVDRLADGRTDGQTGRRGTWGGGGSSMHAAWRQSL